jgi:hypothetical protein
MAQESDDRALTWAALLGRWTEFARSAVALPKKGETGRFRAAVPDIIALQALTHALAEVDELPLAERAVAMDTAGVQVQKHTAGLHEVWRGEALPIGIQELIADARAAFAAARSGGFEWTVLAEELVAEHPGELAAGLVAAGFAGDLFLPAPGIPLFETCPCGFVSGGAREGSDARGPVDPEFLEAITEFLSGGEEEAVSGPSRVPIMSQAYRQFDFLGIGKGKSAGPGGPVRDLVLPMDATLQGGQPLLVVVIEGGKAMPVSLPPRRGAPVGPLPVVFGE